MMEIIWNVLQIVFADIVLSGDNALVIGMAAASLAPKERQKAIFIGLAVAAGGRIFFAVIASHLLGIKGILLIGGVLLAWVCWRFYKDIRVFTSQSIEDVNAKLNAAEAGEKKSFRRALLTILMADISMSIDNVIAVASIAREDTKLLVFGLGLAILLMAFFAQLVMRIMLRFKWLSYLGLLLLIWLTIKMFYDGFIDLGLLLPIGEWF